MLHTTRYLPTRAQRYRDHTHAAASTSREVARGSAGMVAHRDALEQMQRLGRGPVPNIDWQRTLRFAIVGLTLHGPFFYRRAHTML